jgi:hypothetical protein
MARPTTRRPRGAFQRRGTQGHANVDPVAPERSAVRDPTDPTYTEPDVPAGGGAGWRGSVRVASGLNLLAGIWLIIAPFVLGYRDGDPYWNDIVFGAIVAVLAFTRLAGALRQSWLSYLNVLIGIWVFVSAFWLDSSGQAIWNDIILGVIVFVLGLISATSSDDAAAPSRPGYLR